MLAACGERHAYTKSVAQNSDIWRFVSHLPSGVHLLDVRKQRSQTSEKKSQTCGEKRMCIETGSEVKQQESNLFQCFTGAATVKRSRSANSPKMEGEDKRLFASRAHSILLENRARVHSHTSVHELGHASGWEGELEHDQPAGSDEDPPQVTGSFCAIVVTAPRESTYTRAKRKKNTSPKGRDWEGLQASAGLQGHRGLPVVGLVARQFLGWSPASSWVGSPAWGAQSSLLSGSGHVAMSRSAGPCDVRHDSNTLKTKAESIHQKSLQTPGDELGLVKSVVHFLLQM